MESGGELDRLSGLDQMMSCDCAVTGRALLHHSGKHKTVKKHMARVRDLIVKSVLPLMPMEAVWSPLDDSE